jgi:hypothetical protein
MKVCVHSTTAAAVLHGSSGSNGDSAVAAAAVGAVVDGTNLRWPSSGIAWARLLYAGGRGCA